MYATDATSLSLSALLERAWKCSASSGVCSEGVFGPDSPISFLCMWVDGCGLSPVKEEGVGVQPKL